MTTNSMKWTKQIHLLNFTNLTQIGKQNSKWKSFILYFRPSFTREIIFFSIVPCTYFTNIVPIYRITPINEEITLLAIGSSISRHLSKKHFVIESCQLQYRRYYRIKEIKPRWKDIICSAVFAKVLCALSTGFIVILTATFKSIGI